MAKIFPLHPKNPERICWGCDKYCPADSLICGNGSERICALQLVKRRSIVPMLPQSDR